MNATTIPIEGDFESQPMDSRANRDLKSDKFRICRRAPANSRCSDTVALVGFLIFGLRKAATPVDPEVSLNGAHFPHMGSAPHVNSLGRLAGDDRPIEPPDCFAIRARHG